MNVILLLNDIHLDGMGSVAVTLQRALKSQGVDCVALHAYDEIDLPGYREEFSPRFVSDTKCYGTDRETVTKLVRTLNGLAQDGDVVICNGSPNWMATMPYLRPGVRWITGVHSINPSTLKICRAYAERVSAFVCISEGVRRRFLEKLPQRYHSRVHLICNAVDDCLKPKTDYRIGTTLRILFVGRIEDTSKGCGKLPKILALLKRRGISVHLDLYGYFHNWEAQWWTAVDKAGVRDLVSYCGTFDHAKIYDLLVKYDVFIAPSNFEGFPLSTSEAMMAGLPIVASAIPGVTDWICEYGKCAALVRKTDIAGFAAALERIARDEGYRSSIGSAARVRILSLASFDAHSKSYAALARACSSEPFSASLVAPPLDRFEMPECLKPWGLARLLPTGLKAFLRRFM